MFEFQKAQLALDEAAVALIAVFGENRNTLLAASYAFTAQCRLTAKKEYEPCLSNSRNT